MKRIVTSKDLAFVGACRRERRLFKQTFPEGARINLTDLKKAKDAGLNVDWFISHAVTSAGDFSALDQFEAEVGKLYRKQFQHKITWDEYRHEREKLALELLRRHTVTKESLKEE